ncbi:tumor suppressor, Mitostatin-domain-containing protein [Blastocladiella britannica]|nr:tumor suppressor, Mitostatin-domain-containing protein [Blastocladiella britannica]
MDGREHVARRREFAREDLCQSLKQDKVLYDSFVNDERLERVRRAREYRQYDHEQALLEGMRSREHEIEIRRRAKDHNERLVREVQDQHEELVRQEKIRQSICESSIELRELEQKLHYAYMNAERAKQIEHKHLAREQDQQREQEYAAQVAKQLEVAAIADSAAELASLERSHNYKETLQKQLADRADRKREDMELFLREKAMVDALVHRIHEEDAAEQQRRLSSQRETRAYIDAYLRDREQWLATERKKVDDENRRIEDFVRQQESRDQERKEHKRAVEQARSRVYESLAENIGRREMERQELNDLRVELAAAELSEREQERDRAEMQRRIQQRINLIEAYQSQIREKRERREKEREEEDIFRQRMLEKLAAEAKLDQLTREKKRAKQLEHKRAVDAMIEQRRHREELERVAEEEDRRKEQELEAFKKRVIEAERQRLLHEHATKLLGFLPKGVFRKEDIAAFDEEFAQRFKRT